jgi:hypothetical protein
LLTASKDARMVFREVGAAIANAQQPSSSWSVADVSVSSRWSYHIDYLYVEHCCRLPCERESATSQ